MPASKSSRPFRAALALAIVTASCAAPDPEIVAIEYLRATRTAEPDKAVALLDIDAIVRRVQEDVVLVNTDGDPEMFLRDSVQTILWALFQESPREDLTYDATPAEVDGDRARVRVTMTDSQGGSRNRTVHLRRTGGRWRVSGRSIDDLVGYVIQRLEERF